MRQLYLLTALLTLLCGMAAAQQEGAFVERDDHDDPCRHLKMRIIEPAGGVEHKLRVLEAPEGIDPRMEVIVCRREPLQLARFRVVPAPGGGSRVLGPAPRFNLAPQHGGQSQQQPSDLLRPHLPSVVEMMRRRP